MRKYALLLCIVPFCIPAQPSQSAIRPDVPMQGGMLMPMIRYHADENRLSVMMPAETPQLTPLMVSNPADRFDPTSPWFDDLDPSARGWSFSRRYGFVMSNMSDPVPANEVTIWLRKIEGPDDLRIYRYTQNPRAWEPIFGTAGSSNALAWNMMMFHPAFAAPAGTNGYTATFEAYLVDTTSGMEVPGSATAPMAFQWTNVPDGRPDVMAGLAYLVDWDGAATNYVLETATSLDAADWTTVTNASLLLDGRQAIIMRPEEAAGSYFRLRRVDE